MVASRRQWANTCKSQLCVAKSQVRVPRCQVAIDAFSLQLNDDEIPRYVLGTYLINFGSLKTIVKELRKDSPHSDPKF